jgi:MoaA/NifB/PqqE/SkfB family radical SAM enzyme
VSYVSPHKVFAHLDRLVAWREAERGLGPKPAPVTVEWDLSNRCVLGCQDCHFAHTHTRGPWTSRRLPMAYEPADYESTGDLADLALVRRALAELYRTGVKAVVWSGGGEPTVHPAWVEIVALAASYGLEQGIYTLGGLLDRTSAQSLADAATWVVVSLDAPDAATYAAEKGVPADRFDAACQGVRWLANGPAVVGVSFLLHAANWWRTDEMLDLTKRLGATYATFRPAIQTRALEPNMCDESREWITKALPTLVALAQEPCVELDVDRYLAYRDWKGHDYDACLGIRLTTTITPDGRVWVCPQRRGIAGSCLGDLRIESFDEIWARHPGRWTDFGQCRVMCRMHLVNQVLATVDAPHAHEAFV